MATPASVSPLLVLAWGNASRGDDALGPLLLAHLRALPWPLGQVEFLEDYQLQIEHALDLVGREQVLLVDASVSAAAPFDVMPLSAAPDACITTHALSPQALLQVLAQVHSGPAPACTLLAIRGDHFELGAPPTPAALAHLTAASAWAVDWLNGALRGLGHA